MKSMREAASSQNLDLRNACVVGNRVLVSDAEGQLYQWTGDRFSLLCLVDAGAKGAAHHRRALRRFKGEARR